MFQDKLNKLTLAIQDCSRGAAKTSNLAGLSQSLASLSKGVADEQFHEIVMASQDLAGLGVAETQTVLLCVMEALLQLEMRGDARQLIWRWAMGLQGRWRGLLDSAERYLSDSHWAEAEVIYEVLCQLDPESADCFHNRGFALERLGRNLQALGCYGRAIALRPAFHTAYCNLGNALFNLNRLEEAINFYKRASQLRPDYVGAMNNLANAYAQFKQPERSIPLLESIVALNPGYSDALNNLGFALQKLGRHAEALPYLQQAVESRPDYAEAFNNLGHSLHKLSRFEEALTAFERAMSLKPNYSEAYWNRGLVRLLLGDSSGWEDLEWRWRRANYQAYPSTRDSKPWRGEDLSGKSIVVTVEQGYGDMFQLSRFLLPIVEAGADVTFATPRVIHRLLSTLSPQVRLVGALSETGEHQFHAPIFSLPRLLGFRFDAVYAPVPYLSAEQDLVEIWRRRIGQQGFKVGISWQGNPAGDVDTGRSMPLQQLARLAKVPGVRLISIQFQHGLEQLADLGIDTPVEVLEGFNQGPDGFVDTAAVMKCLDLVITTDSAPAHLAGALNVPVWTLLMEVPDWRWLLAREDSPWYPSMRLFRQTTSGDWADVMDRVILALERLRKPTDK